MCIPITAQNTTELSAQIQHALLQFPDFVEWRRDYFESLSLKREDQILNVLKTELAGTGLIYTFRDASEGGVGTWDGAQRLERILKVFAGEQADYVDVEAATPEQSLAVIRNARDRSKTRLILSHHDFSKTGSIGEITATLEEIAAKGADVIKIALMAHNAADVRRAIAAISPFSQRTDKPVIFVSMGHWGTVVRALPESVGGSLTFAANGSTTAPGQLSPAKIRQMRRTMGFQNENIALIGYMGTGKSTIGPLLAAKLGFTFVDTDAVIEKKIKMTISDFFAQRGEPAFRKLECQVLEELLRKKNQVIATGGGIVLQKENRCLLREKAFTVHLTADAETIFHRVSGNKKRPLLNNQSDLLAHIQNMMDERASYYAIGHITLDTGTQSADEIVQRIVYLYGKPSEK